MQPAQETLCIEYSKNQMVSNEWWAMSMRERKNRPEAVVAQYH